MSTNNMQCKYAYKECHSMRTYKRDGELHRLCEHHREKANALQKIYATKRRGELRALKRQALEEKVLRRSVDPLPFIAPAIKVEAKGCDDESPVTIDDVICLFDGQVLEPIDLASDVEGLSDEEYAYLLSEVF
ncbi:Aste57867_142 [Aphanomyces stellatus]|uniref:Aste57867_142 protein n=1 Tax=Aphanomyces stellatus TaxID=120398 RepID=A0A485K2Y8_9STRA|nr:hypothetical protein As57867_000142 [Aphanomyces stellatus]VFT77368.1 Aste57867_142 [Aphanomyces stellatus]